MRPGIAHRLVGAALAMALQVLLAVGAAAEEHAAGDAANWSGSASVIAYLLPQDDDYLQPEIDVDIGALHLELRYNYEALDTASAWVGYNFTAGRDVQIEFTPMLGVVFGDTNGVAPGFNFGLTWKSLSLYSEFEHVFDSDDSSESFLYAWSELAWALGDTFRIGFVGQRTKTYLAPRDIQRGILAGATLGRADLTGYVFNPDDGDPIYVLALAVGFGPG